MGDRSPTSDNVYSIFGHAIGKTYKFVTKWNTDKSPANKSENEAEAKFDAKFEAYKKVYNNLRCTELNLLNFFLMLS